MPSDMRTVWVPAESYLWDWLPLTFSSTVPSPQSMVYVPRAGMVIDWPGAVVFQVVTKSDSDVFSTVFAVVRQVVPNELDGMDWPCAASGLPATATHMATTTTHRMWWNLLLRI